MKKQSAFAAKADELRAAIAATRARLTESVAAFDKAKSAAADAALSDSGAALDRAIDELRRCELRRDAYGAALAHQEADLSAAQKAEADHADMEVRRATAADLSERADKIEAAVGPAASYFADLFETLEGGRAVFGEVGLLAVARELAQSLPESLRVLAAEIRQASAATLDPSSGHPPTLVPAPLRLAEVSMPLTSAPMVDVVVWRAFRWRTGDGIATAQIGDRVSLPEALAHKAIAGRIAVAPDHGIAGRLIEGRFGRGPATNTIDLDATLNPLDQQSAVGQTGEPENYRAHESYSVRIVGSAHARSDDGETKN